MIRELMALRGATVRDFYAAIDSSRPAHDSLLMWNLREELYVLKVDVDVAGAWRTRGLLPAAVRSSPRAASCRSTSAAWSAIRSASAFGRRLASGRSTLSR